LIFIKAGKNTVKTRGANAKQKRYHYQKNFILPTRHNHEITKTISSQKNNLDFTLDKN